MAVPDDLARTIVNLYDAKGIEWLNRLPALIAECEQRWSVAVLSPLDNLSFNYIAPAVGADGREVILKLAACRSDSWPGSHARQNPLEIEQTGGVGAASAGFSDRLLGVPNPELLTEIEALRLYDGRGCVRLLAADPGQGAMLLERLRPGTLLSTVTDDQQATSIAAGVMRQLWRPVPSEHPFPSVDKWAAGLGRLRARFGGTTGPLPQALVERAESLFAELLASMAEPLLLHGDLHHDNILAAERQPWLAIDPKGIVGEPAYEVGALLRNPFPQLLDMPQPGRILARRVDQLAELLGFDRLRIVGWGMAQAVLAAWWCIEDNTPGWEEFIACAELLAALGV